MTATEHIFDHNYDRPPAKDKMAAVIPIASLSIREAATQPDVAARYRVDQKPVELIAELQSVIARELHEGERPTGVVMARIDQGSKFGDVARYLEAHEFKMWYPDEEPATFAEEMAKEYGAYEEESRFVLILDNDTLDENGLPKLVGMARVVGGREDQLKTLNDMPEVWGIDKETILDDIKKCESESCKGDERIGRPEYTWDYSSLTVSEEYRGSGAYQMLSHEIFAWSEEQGVSTVTTILVKNFYTLYKYRGVPFRPIAGAEFKVHMGELSVPAVMHIPETPDMLTNTKNPRAAGAYREMAMGEGLMPYNSLTV